MCICIPARSASLPISACMNFSSTSHFCRQDYSQILFDYAILQLACGPLEVVPLVVALPEPRLWPLRRGTGASFSFLSYLFDWKSCRHPFFPPVLAITLTIVFIFYSKRGRKSWIGEVQCRRYDASFSICCPPIGPNATLSVSSRCAGVFHRGGFSYRSPTRGVLFAR
ncbi:hypothetical protein F4825DRAFT_89686 [Nemania diffusa]|nr:hypothetical protein F4825DRAFT_89686 [Nemania diffusa]